MIVQVNKMSLHGVHTVTGKISMSQFSIPVLSFAHNLITNTDSSITRPTHFRPAAHSGLSEFSPFLGG